MIRAPLVLFPLMLAACSQQPEEVAPGGDVPTAVASATSSPAPEASSTPVQSPTPQTIPVAAQGRWGLVAADCTSTRGDAKGLLVIGSTSLKFYESVGQLGAIKERSDTSLRAGFAFSGEGMNWSREETLDVQDAGNTMIRREYGADALPGPFKYTKCL